MKNLITVLIVDDELDSREGMEALIKDNLPELSVIAKAENTRQALEIIIDESPEIIFLDVQMPQHNGFWLAEKLKRFRINNCIVFVTAFDQYAIQALRHAAFDFLTKPVDLEKLKDVVARFKQERNKYNLNRRLNQLEIFLARGKVRFNMVDGFIMITPEDIIFCEADKNYSFIHLINGKSHLITSQLGVLEKMLDNKGTFVRISRSTLINLDYLERYIRKTKTVILTDILQKYELKASISGTRKLLSI